MDLVQPPANTFPIALSFWPLLREAGTSDKTLERARREGLGAHVLGGLLLSYVMKSAGLWDLLIDLMGLLHWDWSWAPRGGAEPGRPGPPRGRAEVVLGHKGLGWGGPGHRGAELGAGLGPKGRGWVPRGRARGRAGAGLGP